MTNLNISPFIGAVLLSDKVWDRLPKDILPELQASMRRIETELDRNVVELEVNAVQLMRDYGLEIHELSDETKKLWYREFDNAYQYMVGPVISKEIYSMIRQYVSEIRK